MPRASYGQDAFNGGYLGPLMRGRASHPKYRTGGEVFEQIWPTVQGAAVKRPGTRKVKRARNGVGVPGPAKLISFIASDEAAYVLEFTAGFMRVYRDDGAVTEVPLPTTGAPTATNPVRIPMAPADIAGLANFDEVFISGTGMSEINGRWFSITVNATNIELNGENGVGRATGAGGTVARAYELALPLNVGLFSQWAWAQSVDVLYVTGPDTEPFRIIRRADADWSVETLTYTWPPFEDENTDENVTVVADFNTGAGVTLTASAPIFQAGHVGGFFRLAAVPEEQYPPWSAEINPATLQDQAGFGSHGVAGSPVQHEGNVYRIAVAGPSTGLRPPVHEEGQQTDGRIVWEFYNPGSGYGEIISVAPDGLSCQVDVIVPFPFSVSTTHDQVPFWATGNPTDKWSFGAFSFEEGYPAAVTFFDDRLYFAGTEKNPQTFWGSEVGNYDDFRLADRDDRAVRFTLNVRDLNRIDWLAGEDVLFLGTRGGEFVAAGPNGDEAITGSQIPRVRRRTRYGTRPYVRPEQAGNTLVFAQTAGRKLFGLVFDEASQSYSGEDLTRFADDILLSGIREIHALDEPYRQLLVVQEDGVPVFCSISPEESVVAFSRCPIGGTDARLKSAAVVPHPENNRDRVWCVIERTINGTPIETVEYFESEWVEGLDQVGDEFYVDGGLSAVNIGPGDVFGLECLAGETVDIVADGVPQPRQVVAADGSITLAANAGKLVVGAPMADGMRFLSSPVDAGAADGTALGRRGRIHKLTFNLYATGYGFQYGPAFDCLVPLENEDRTLDPASVVIPKRSGYSDRVDMPATYPIPMRVAFVHDQPLPCTVLGWFARLDAQGDG